jgi:hypothetical protein
MMKWILKAALFSALVLVLGNVIRWNGKTISDQVKTKVSHAEHARITEQMKGWAKGLTSDAKMGSTRKSRSEEGISPIRQVAHEEREARDVREEIPSSERQKLRALIRDLKATPAAQN